ncbi:hypothetical protein SAMN05192562_1011439 [Kosakonia arachidis]|uniref:Uncharacterized protein n=1 Tax=Kosakonia arachidis TaxID=551989 RepID=A0A1I6ZY40_9ENTR|nr:hypothetical protein [Kosakonia arachidis]SFT67586.1 hypothetical protein SAMN05192562_1011439 [Kosakonia arachidis]
MLELFTPQKIDLNFGLKQLFDEKLKSKVGKMRYNILYISARPGLFFDRSHDATTEFSKHKMSYLMHKGHNVTGAYASTVAEFIETWNAIGKNELQNINKVIIDYHGAISPKRGYQSLIVISPSELLDKHHISMLENKPGVKVVSLYSCYSGFLEKYNPAVGFLGKLTAPDAHVVGFDAQGDNDMQRLKTVRHYDAGEQFDRALSALKINRLQLGRVKYSKIDKAEIMLQHYTGNIRRALSDYMC